MNYFGLQSILKLPVFVSYHTKFKSIKGRVIFKDINNIKPFTVLIGFGDTSVTDFSEKTYININGDLIFNGLCKIGSGSFITIGINGILSLGNNFRITGRSSISCYEKISFGDNCLLSWDVLIMDTDAHGIFSNNSFLNPNQRIIIGNNVWIGCRNTILKGSKIPNNSVLASGSIINKSFDKENTILGGIPAKILKENIKWAGDL